MSIRTVGIISPGDMGAGTGKVLHENGMDVVTCLEGRSDLSRLRAREAGFRSLPSLDEVVRQSDMVVSVLVPGEAAGLAEAVAAAMGRTGARPAYVDANAIAPQTVEHIHGIMTPLGVNVIDVGILGSPPRPGRVTRYVASGPDTSPFETLGTHGLTVQVVGKKVGQASGLKMCYAASTKGATALFTELLAAARAMDLQQALLEQWGYSRADISKAMMAAIPNMPRRARRWVSEMEEIAKTFQHLGMTPKVFEGAADLYRQVGETRLADLTSRDPEPPLDLILDTLLAQAKKEALGK